MPPRSPEYSPHTPDQPEASGFAEGEPSDPASGHSAIDLDYFLKTHPPLGEDPRHWFARLRTETESGSGVVKGVESPRDLSEDGQMLYKILLGEAGDTEFLAALASEVGFDLEAALAELRQYGVLDESDPIRVRLAREDSLKDRFNI